MFERINPKRPMVGILRLDAVAVVLLVAERRAGRLADHGAVHDAPDDRGDDGGDVAHGLPPVH
jgi:hypothetical protein